MKLLLELIEYYFFLIKHSIEGLLFGYEVEENEETQDDEYLGGQCFYDPVTGKKECE